MNHNKTSWGIEMVWANTDKYSSRVLIVKENESLPYIYHRRQDITLFILQGIIQLTVEGRVKILNEGDTYHLPPKIRFRISAMKGDATILEAGTKLEDDVVEIEK